MQIPDLLNRKKSYILLFIKISFGLILLLLFSILVAVNDLFVNP